MSTSVMATVLVTFQAQDAPLTGGGAHMEALEGREVGCMLGFGVVVLTGGFIRAW